MNIAVCVNSLSAGGAEIFAASIAIEYHRKAHNVILVVLNILDNKGHALEKLVKSNDIEIINLEYKAKVEMIKYPYILAKIFKKHNIDIIHSHLEQMDFFVMLSGLFYSKPIKIRTLHSMNALPKFPYSLHKLLFNKFDRSIGCGKLMKKNYTIPKLRNKIFPIDNGIPVNLYNDDESRNIRNNIRERLGIKKDEFIFLQIGRMTPVLGALCKGHDFTFEAVHLLQRQDFKMIFIGDDSVKNDPSIYDQALLKDKRLIFEGIVSDPIKYILASDAILAPSRVEGLPISTLEGAFYGKPIVCSNIEVFDIFLNNSSLRMDVNNTNTLVDKISEMIDNYSEFHSNAITNITYYQENYSITKTTEQYLSIIESLIKK